MKRIHILSIGLLLSGMSTFTFGQNECACNNVKIQSPVVKKPTEANQVSATCSTLVVKWKGTTGQTYLLSGLIKDPATNKATGMATASDVTADTDQQYTATLSVVAGTKVSWSVQATQAINGRTFYSYPLRGDQDYMVPGCPSGGRVGAPELGNTEKKKVILFPNPAQSTLTVDLNGMSKNGVVKIFDIHGRSVLSRQVSGEVVQFSVRSLGTGTYFVIVEDGSGNVVSNARFLKE